MNQNSEQIELDRTPTPQEEAVEFSTPDERADERAKGHELALLNAKMGFVGKLIGTEFAARNIALIAIVASFLAIALVFCFSYDSQNGGLSESVSSLLALLVSIVTGCLGYIFGSTKD